jgi:two-component system, sporulation sensor kinase D
MEFSERRNFTRWLIICASFVIISLILWNTYQFFQIFKQEERLKMETYAAGQRTLSVSPEDNELALNLSLQIISSNETIPVIVTSADGTIENTINIEDYIASDPRRLKNFLLKLSKENDPITMVYDETESKYLYYGNSSLLNKLKYYPIALLLIIVLFGGLVYNFYKSTKMATQNKLWAGMAKETAHQIGTPLSSLIGWLEIMRADNVDPDTVDEIEKDISRLQSITDRFSKIGSEPVLETLDFVKETEQSIEYLKSRFSKQVVFTFTAPHFPVMVSMNAALHSWTVENLVKNSIDAMRGRGNLDIAIIEDERNVKLYISDTGKGIPKSQYKRVFEPGFTTKKRGWGLGLSLTKRIVEEYHKGKIRVSHSEVGKGTTMQVTFRKLSESA